MSEQLKLAKELYNDPRMMLTPLDLVSTPLDLAPTPLRCSSYKHPWTPPHPTPNCVFGNLLDVPIHWAFPVTVRSQGLAAAALGYGQVVLGAKKVALSPAPRSRSGPVQVSATFFAPSATWPWPGATAARPWPNK